MVIVEQTSAPEQDGTVAIADERAITALLYRSARYADEGKFVEWMQLFTDDAEYAAITNENLKAAGLYLYRDRGRRALTERAAYQKGIWQVPRGKLLHLVTNIQLEPGESEGVVQGMSYFLIARTDELEHSKLHACGRYVDSFRRIEGRWLIQRRQVVIDSNLLPGEFTELL